MFRRRDQACEQLRSGKVLSLQAVSWVSLGPPRRASECLPKNEVPASGRDSKNCFEKELGSAALIVAVLILFVGLVLTALFLLVLTGLAALLALSELTGLTAALLALVTLLTFLLHIVCHDTFS
jgi:hypothetical protein